MQYKDIRVSVSTSNTALFRELASVKNLQMTPAATSYNQKFASRSFQPSMN